ncbi:MAG TPA: urease accessory protein UreD [Streptosporangiaceae bacterium]|nr:urease accessory protein UreD [Streptosporangiaceae bacterium]
MRARAELVADRGPAGELRLPVQRSQAPLVLRRTADAVYLVSGAAGPLGGDQLELHIEVRAGARLRLRTVAAAVALPGRSGEESRLAVTATVGPGARLEYLPEPLVAADGARHRTELAVELAEGAALLLRDEVLLGRHGEQGGRCLTRLRVNLAGRPLLRHELDVDGADPAARGPAVLAGHRAAGTLLSVEPEVADGAGGFDGTDGTHEVAGFYGAADPWVAVMPLAGPGVLVTALADDTRTLRQRLTRRARPRQLTA